MKRLLLHIGPHKTASTFLQAHMVSNSEMLEANGVLYPDLLRVGPGHQRVVGTLKSGDLAPLEAMREASSGFDTLVLSTENFTKLSLAQIELLAGVFDGYEIDLLYYYRGSHQLWPSHWQETIKHGRHEDWPQYLMTVMGFATRDVWHFVNPESVLEKWSKVLGSDRIHIFPYAAIGDDPRDALRPMAKLLGVECAAFSLEEKGRNASYSSERIEALRVLNLRNVVRGGEVDSQLRRSYMKKVKEIENSSAFSDLKDHFAMHAKDCVLRPQSGFLAHLEDQVLTSFERQFMVEPAQKETQNTKVVRYLDPGFPVPDHICVELEQLLGAC